MSTKSKKGRRKGPSKRDRRRHRLARNASWNQCGGCPSSEKRSAKKAKSLATASWIGRVAPHPGCTWPLDFIDSNAESTFAWARCAQLDKRAPKLPGVNAGWKAESPPKKTGTATSCATAVPRTNADTRAMNTWSCNVRGLMAPQKWRVTRSNFPLSTTSRSAHTPPPPLFLHSPLNRIALVLSAVWAGLATVTSGSGAELQFAEVGSVSGVDDLGNGVGVTMGDLDGDGDLDVYVTNRYSANKLYRNDGDLVFVEIGSASGVDDSGNGRDRHGAVMGDLDGDGDLDMYVTNNGQNRLFRNDGNLVFTEVGSASVVDDSGNGVGVVMGDLDGDGDLDIYVVNWGGQNRLYRNDGGLAFVEAGSSSEVDDSGNGLGVTMGDLDGDGDLDIYVVNANSANKLYRNDGGLVFAEIGSASGTDDSGYGAGVVMGDLDGDGDLDVYLINNGGQNKLYRNDGNLVFTEVGSASGVDDSGSGRGAVMGDFDGDGDLDIYLAKVGGNNRLYRNDGNLDFVEIGNDVGVDDSGDGWGVTMGDLDGDGDLDIYLNNNGQNRLYRNDGASPDWLAVRPLDCTGRQTLHGASVRLLEAGTSTAAALRTIDGGGGYMSRAYGAHFGLDQLDSSTMLDIEVQMPGSAVWFTKTNVSALGGVAQNQTLDVVICCEGGYFNSGCMPCAPGTFTSQGGPACEVCVAGGYCPEEGMVSPIPCDVGKYCPEGATSSISCTTGRYAPATGSVECEVCAAGGYCPEGTASPIPCEAGNYCLEGVSSPVPCVTGRYAPNTGLSECLMCERGHFQPSPGKAFCSKCYPGSYQNTEGSALCLSCPAGNFCAGEGTQFPEPCKDSADGSQEYCEEGVRQSVPCPQGHFCTNSTVKMPCVAGVDFCPEGSSQRGICPDDSVCSLGFTCADNSEANAWFNTTQSTDSTVSVDLDDLPDCSFGVLTPEIQGPEVVKLTWDEIDCDDLTTTFSNSFLGELTDRSYTFEVEMFNPSQGSTFRAAMEGTPATTSFSSLLSVPFDALVTFSLRVDMVLTVGPAELCAIKSFSFDSVDVFMPLPPPDVSSVTASITESSAARANVTWSMSGSASEQEHIVAFNIFTDRNFDGIFLEIDETEVSVGAIRSLEIDLVAGHEYQFRVQAFNDRFGGEPSAPSVSLQVPCPSGQFKRNDGGCSLCAAGTFSSGTSPVCETCPVTTFSTGGASVCTECDVNEVPTEERSACFPCSPGEFRSSSMQTCSTCEDLTVSAGGGADCRVCEENEVPTTEQSSCVPCVAGEFRNTEMSACQKCPGNQFNGGGGDACQPCEENSVANDDKSACLPCSVGEYRDADMGECEKCPGNQFSGGGGDACQPCEENFIANDDKSACLPCSVGEYRDVDMLACEKCPGNQFSGGGGASCQECGLNKVANEVKSACTACDICPAGSRVVAECSFADGTPTICEKCGGGFFQDQPDQPHCLECPQGHFCPSGASEETVCPKGTYCEAFSILPASLSSGFYAADARGNRVDEGGVRQQECEGGFYCSGGDRTECETGDFCPPGSSEPSQCPAASFCPDPSQRIECQSGSYCPSGSTAESNCTAGYFCSTPAGVSACPQGNFCPLRSTIFTPCSVCSVGEGFVSSCDVNGNDSECQPCASNAVSVGGTSACSECPENSRPNDSQSACIPCKVCAVGEGIVSPCSERGDTICSPCAGGQYSSGGSSVCQDCQKGHFCPPGSSSPRPCLKGSYCNSTVGEDQQLIWGSTEEPCPSGTYCPSGSSLPVHCPSGATCTIPASPELVIEHNAVLERRESELIVDQTTDEVLGEITYALSLSVKPNLAVTVTVTKDTEPTAECVKYTDGVAFDTSTYVFEPSKWNVTQTVEIGVRRKANTLQGTFIIRFNHDITSEDPVWRSAFLRPTTLTISDDSECPNGAQKHEDIIYRNTTREFTIRKCFCSEGFFVARMDSQFCDSASQCTECPPGMVCGQHQRLEEAEIEPGKYRPHTLSTTVVGCRPHGKRRGINCKGGAGNTSAHDGLCRVGHEGPMCQLCVVGETERYVWSGEECELCDSAQMATLSAFAGAVLLLLCAAVFVIFRNNKNKTLHRTTTLHRALEAMNSASNDKDFPMARFLRKACVKYKIVVTFTQLLSKISTLYPIRLPENYLEFQRKSNPFAFMDIELVPLNCWIDVSFHRQLLIMTVAPAVFVSLVAILCAIRSTVFKWDGTPEAKEQQKILQANCIYMAIAILYTAFPLISVTIFRTFSYDARLEDDPYGGVYLKADYGIQRDDSSQRMMETYAIVMGLAYCCGIPIFSFIALWQRKEQIQQLQEMEWHIVHKSAGQDLCSLAKKIAELKASDPMMEALLPLYGDYEARFWWFEIIRFLCTLALMGMVILSDLEDSTQIFMSFCASTAMLLAIANWNPYLHQEDDKLAQCCQASLSLVICVGWLEASKDSDSEASNDSGPESANGAFGFMLIYCVVFNLTAGFGAIGIEFFKATMPKRYEKLATFLRGWRIFAPGKLVASADLAEDLGRRITVRASSASRSAVVPLEVGPPEIGAATPNANSEQAGQQEGPAAADNLEEQKREQLEPELLVTDVESHFQDHEGTSSGEVRGSEAAGAVALTVAAL